MAPLATSGNCEMVQAVILLLGHLSGHQVSKCFRKGSVWSQSYDVEVVVMKKCVIKLTRLS